MIRRVPLRERVFQALVDRFFRGEIPAGARLSDSVLARELGVSRTPVREALMRLEREGFVASDLGRGFFVTAPSAAELRRLLPIFAALQGLAVREGHPHGPALLARLAEVDAELAAHPDDAERAVRLHLRWHQLLIDACGNAFLRAQLASVSRLLRRYAHAYWRGVGHARDASEAHAPVAAALAAGDAERAAALLEAYWHGSLEEMAVWLERGGPSPAR